MEKSFTALIAQPVFKVSRIGRLICAGTFIGILASCSPSNLDSETLSEVQPETPNTILSAVELPEFDVETALLVRQIAVEYLNQVENDFNDLGAKLSELQATINEFIEVPTAELLKFSQEKWLAAHLSFQQSRIHFKFLSTTASMVQSTKLAELVYRIDHWPILAGYIDSVEGYPQGGIVHDVNVELSAPSLGQQHGLFDSTEATLGFHVMEFLLWGEPHATGIKRTAGDFSPLYSLTDAQLESGMEVSQLGNNRRRQFLNLLSAILIEDFESAATIRTEANAAFISSIEDRNASEMLVAMLDSITSILDEELLARSLYMLLNGDLESALQSPYSQTSEMVVARQLQSVERLLLETPTPGGVTLDKILISLSPNFEDFFYQNLDANKACLVLLYSGLSDSSEETEQNTDELELVECINLLTNLVDQLEQIKLNLPVLSRPI